MDGDSLSGWAAAGVLALAALFVWGVVSPRSQWYAMVGWARSDPKASEPGPGAYSAARVLSLIGAVVVGVLAIGPWVAGLDLGFGDRRPPTEAERVWGPPRPTLVDRVYLPSTAAPEGLVPVRISGYQQVDRTSGTTDYLYRTVSVRDDGIAASPGFIGVAPLPNARALDTADLVVRVIGDDRCIPQSVVVVPGELAIQVGVYFGRPLPADGTVPDPAEVADCDPDPADGSSRVFLLPIDMSAPLGDRDLQDMSGAPIELVPAPLG